MNTIEKVESIMHMVVNFGEQPDYANKIYKLTLDVSKEMFGGNLHVTQHYFNAKFAIEVMEHLDSYEQYVDEHNHNGLAEIIVDLCNTFANCLAAQPEVIMVVSTVKLPPNVSASGCPRCGSHEGDAQECPECGHGQ